KIAIRERHGAMSTVSGPTPNPPGLRNFAVTLSYNGTRYGGWQIQNNATSIQQKLQEAIAQATSEHVIVRGSGRTDSGVHAMGQVATFRLEKWRAPSERLVPAINRYLPRSIVVKRCREAVLEFDPTRDDRVNDIVTPFAIREYQMRCSIPFNGGIPSHLRSSR
ncbi:MAG: hypothetical protein MUC43_04245, partial [Pirellula sp.]|nr:hypothetical protein [Pirellula sp.]